MNVPRASMGAFFALLLTAVMVVVFAGSSQAEPKKLLVSNSADGPFRDNLGAPLFRDDATFVPLDQATNTFYVKNNSKQAARATVRVVNRGPVAAFEDALTFDIDIDGTSAEGSVPLPGTPGCSLTVTGPSLKPGAVQAIDIALAVGDLPAQVGQDQAATLDFVVTLSQTGKSGEVAVCGAQAVAEPEVKGAEGNAGGDNGSSGDGDGGDCDRDVVVTVAGSPTCVPSAVDAGATYGGGEPRSAGTISLVAGLMLAGGACLVTWATRRRRTA